MSAVLPPRVVIAAPSSGSGKTTITTGLLGALAARGTVPAPFKIGPDYVDPGYHALASGRPGRNLDPVLCGADRLAPLVAHGAAGAALAVVEGVMGLFDGRLSPGGGADARPPGIHPDDGSTAHVARVLDAPVVLVVDARGQHRSVAALLHGFRAFDPRVAPAGVILNRVGTERHADALRVACAEVGVPVLGVVPRRAELAVPSRHLGLITAAEHGADARAAVDAMTALVAAHVDLDAVERLARRAPATPVEPWDPVLEVAPTDRRARRVVAVAGGPAFTFGYPEHAELLQAAGGEVVVVDPLRDEALPERTAGLVLPGGFPEEHLEALSANVALRSAVHAFATAGGAVHAECGGLLYLGRSLDGAPMCGVLDAEAAMGPRLTLGYRTATALVDSPVAARGEIATGHEFHRTVTTPRAGATPAWAWNDTTEGFVQGNVHASYLHTHPAGRPQAVRRFVAGLVGPP
ncbi:cobyrinate a,c-diamide synthase [Actinomycetospora chiangmaiensis]|uniref:cobyrinate a,c-diamide synthase n=1 Tax=Actinomycetospora chiangmaiensis TaxID=402650 RepID=UPI00039AB184|nr:cobyrinate a,c-diamide synthase [Actinomycetospora chiangmaiensis]